MTDAGKQKESSQEAAPVANGIRSRRRIAVRVVVYALVFYGTYCAVLGCIQDRLIFPRDMAPPPLKWPTVAGTVEWERRRDDGSKGVAWFVPAPSATAANPAPCVVFFHGNAEIIDHQVEIMNGYRRLGCNVLLPEFPGYGRSEGKPGEKSIVDDAMYFVGRLADEPRVDANRIFVHGRSIGGGAAAQVAARCPPAGLILECTFTSLASMADGYFVPRFLVRHPFYTDRVVKEFRAPLLIFHGTRDTIIPVRHGRALRDLATQSASVRYIEYDCGHNEFPGRDNEADYWRNIKELVNPRAGEATNE